MSQQSVPFPSTAPIVPPFVRARRGVLLLLKIILSVALLWVLVRRTKFDFAELIHADVRYLSAALFLLFLQPILAGFRWRIIMQALGAKLAPLRAVAIVFISNFLSLFLPASVGGDLVRIWYLKRNRVPTVVVMKSIFMDRLIALFTIFLMIVVSLPFAHYVISDVIVLAALRSIGIMGVVSIAFLFVAGRILERWKDHRWLQILMWPSAVTRQTLMAGSATWRMLAISVVIHIMPCLATGLIAHAYGADISIAALFILVPPVILAFALPISLGGWGVREAAMVAALSSIGISGQTAFLVSLMLGILTSAANLPGFIFWIVYRHKYVVHVGAAP